MAKRKTKKSVKTHNSNKILKYTAWILALIAFSLTVLVVGYYFGYKDANSKVKHTTEVVKKVEHKKSVQKRLEDVLKKQQTTTIFRDDVSGGHEFKDESLALPPKVVHKKVVKKHIYKRKPILAIIIDDVTTASQIRHIKATGIKVTMSFLPPSSPRPNSAKLASKENIYMVHLPTQAQSFAHSEPKTLKVTDSKRVISQRIVEIKKLFPRVRYLNNHTGSKFTADERAMRDLLLALKANHIKFIDSRTTAKTKAPKLTKELGMKYVARDVFLDHHMDKAYVLSQIKQAIKVAKAHGHAIAIGHPHKNTLEALKESKGLLKQVELVYIDRYYKAI